MVDEWAAQIESKVVDSDELLGVDQKVHVKRLATVYIAISVPMLSHAVRFIDFVDRYLIGHTWLHFELGQKIRHDLFMQKRFALGQLNVAWVTCGCALPFSRMHEC